MESSHYRLLAFESREALVGTLAQRISNVLAEAIKQKDHATLLVSGGSTPKKLFATLSNAPIEWKKVSVGLVDERRVDVESEASNEKLVREHLLTNAAKEAAFYGLMGISEDFEECFNNPDVVVLGMGLDGHTASFFPNDASLNAALYGEEFLSKTTAPTEPHERLTLSRGFLLGAKNLLLHIEGEAKKSVFLNAANTSSIETFPINAMMRQHTPLLEVYYAD